MTAFLLEVAIRAVLIAIGTAAVLRLLRIQTAAVRHAAWTAVVIAMLCLPVWQAGGIRVSLPVLAPAPNLTAGGDRAVAERAAPASTVPLEERALETPAPESATVSRAAAESPFTWQAVLISVYFAGAIVLLLRLLLGTVEANRLRRSAAMRNRRLTTNQSATPITVGWFTPALILPDGWDRWPPAKLAAVLTHEHEHARRHDPLVQWFALFNRAVFWFHPLAWWLERRLSTLAEEACDAAVLAAGHSPQDYSEYLLEMARSVTTDGKRLHIVGMAMPGTGLTGRVQQIFRGLPSVRISRTRVACTIVFCAMSSAMFASGTLAERAAAPQPPAPTTPVHQALAAPPSAAPVPSAEPQPQAALQQALPRAEAPATQIKFEAVLIKPCVDSGPVGGRGGNSPRVSMSPGYAHWGCATLAHLIDEAWGGGAYPGNSLLNSLRLPPDTRLDLPKRIRGGPSWVDNDRWEIEIRVSGDKSDLTGPAHHDWMLNSISLQLRAMLEDKFQLKLRKTTEQRPMYAMTVTPAFNMTASAPEKCWKPEDYPRPPGLSRMELPPPPPGWEGIPACGYQARGGRRQGNESMQFTHAKLSDLAKWLSGEMDLHVLDNTNTPGRFSFSLEFAPDDSTPGIIESSRRFAQAGSELLGRPAPAEVAGNGPTIFKALEKLGLKLNKTTGPAEYLQIESVQRPKAGSPGPDSGTRK
jgi:uncharacterized protein (TIGR03435 family)